MLFKLYEFKKGKPLVVFTHGVTVPWPYDFPRIAREFKRIIDLDRSTIRELVEQGKLL